MQTNMKVIALGLGASALMISAAALAQQYAPPQQTSTRSSARPQVRVSAATLAKFKRAYYSVKSIEHQYSAEVSQVHNNQDALKLRQLAQTKMVSAVKSAGLSIPQYNNVMLLMQREPALRKKVLGH
jgi:hypothetical protein